MFQICYNPCMFAQYATFEWKATCLSSIFWDAQRTIVKIVYDEFKVQKGQLDFKNTTTDAKANETFNMRPICEFSLFTKQSGCVVPI